MASEGMRSVVITGASTGIGEACALHDAHHSTGGGYNARRKYMMGVNTVWFLRRHGTPLRWLSFFVFDVLTLPLVVVYRSLRGETAGAIAKARGTWDGLRGRRVTKGSVEVRFQVLQKDEALNVPKHLERTTPCSFNAGPCYTNNPSGDYGSSHSAFSAMSAEALR